MPGPLYDLLATVTDEASFVRFLTAMREDLEAHERERRHSYYDCVVADHWETPSTKDFLRSMEDWASRGDFGEGVHHGEPILRRIATMLYVGRSLRPEDRPRQ